MRWFFLTALMMAAPPAVAQPPVSLDLPGLLDAMTEPWSQGPGFAARLSEVLPGLDVRQRVSVVVADDPFAWSFDGRFAAIADTVPMGARISCARIGFVTRDFLLTSELSRPAAFEVFRLYDVESDLAEAWPEDAVARLVCDLTWDDTRAVTILSEAGVRATLEAQFAQVQDRQPEGQDLFYGADGYRLRGEIGQSDTVIHLDRADVTLTLRHQSVFLRSYLLNGGM